MWFKKETDVNQLIARGRLEKAIKQLQQELAHDPDNPALRQQLGDVLGRAGRPKEAVATLAPLIQTYSRKGFTGKAIAVVKKIERLAPERTDIDQLIERMQRDAESSPPGPQLIRGFDSDSPPGPRPASSLPTHLHAPAPSSPSSDTGSRKVPVATSKLERDWLHRVASRTNFHWSTVLQPLTSLELTETIGRLELITKHSGAIICGQGDPADSLFILATGFARAFVRTAGPYRQLEVIEEGQFFGEESFFQPDAGRRATVTAASDCELLEIDLGTLRKILLARHSVMDQLEGVYRCRPWGDLPDAHQA